MRKVFCLSKTHKLTPCKNTGISLVSELQTYDFYNNIKNRPIVMHSELHLFLLVKLGQNGKW